MSTTLTEAPPLTVPEARRWLQDTSRLSSAQVAELEQVVAAFHAARPRDRACVACVACGSMIWREHETAAGDSTWACSGCHRASSLTAEAWRAQLAAKREADALRAATEAADAPDPRDALKSALAARAEASTALGALEAAATAALTALSAAQGRHADAMAGMQAAEQSAIERAAGQRTARSSDLPVDAARGRLRLSEDALSAARGARALIGDRLHCARQAVTNAEAALRAAALRVITSEELETTIAAAVAARAAYLTSVSELAFLLRLRAIPAGDARPAQLVREASDAPPALWPESAAAAEAPRLAARLAQLEG